MTDEQNDFLKTMADKEKDALKFWYEMHPKKQMASPMCPTDEIKKLISYGFMKPNVDSGLVIGYSVTTAGEEALNRLGHVIA